MPSKGAGHCALSHCDSGAQVLKRQLHLLRDFIAFFVADSLNTMYTRVVPTLTPALRPIVQTISHLARTRYACESPPRPLPRQGEPEGMPLGGEPGHTRGPDQGCHTPPALPTAAPRA